MTTGKYLKQILKERNVSVTDLVHKMELNSRSVIYRLFDNYYSDKKTAELIDGINKIVGFSEEEKKTINELINSQKVSSFYRTSRKILLNLYSDNPQCGFFVNTGEKEQTLLSLLKECVGSETVIFMSECTDVRAIGDIYNFLSKHDVVNIYNFIRLYRHRISTAYEIYAMLMLARYDSYHPLIIDEDFHESIVIYTKRNDKCYICRITKFIGEYSCLKTEISKEFYDDAVNKLKILSEASFCPRKINSRVIDYIELINNSIEIDNGTVFYSEGCPCFGNIPYDILLDMFKDANYFGFPPDHKYVHQLKESAFKRVQLFLDNPLAKKRFLFDEKQIVHMIKTGLFFDHIEKFKPATKEQLKNYLQYKINMAKNKSDKIQFRFLRNKFAACPFVYVNNKLIYQYSSVNGYGMGYSTTIDKAGIIDIMNDFVNYIWEEMTLSEEESIKKLEQLMDTYL